MDNLPGLITAFVALIAAIGAIFQNKAGRKEAARQTRAAQELERREQAFTESEAALTAHKELGITYREEIERLRAERERTHTEHQQQLRRHEERGAVRVAECARARADLAQMVTVLSEALKSDVYNQMTRIGMEADQAHTGRDEAQLN